MSVDPAANPRPEGRAHDNVAGDAVRWTRHAVADLHAELVRNGLVS